MIKKILKFTAILILVCILAVGGFVFFQINKAPSLDLVDATPDGYLTVLLDKDGKEILSLHDSESNRVYVEMDLISKDLQNAFVAIEDSRFYTHKGVDFKGIARAFFVGVKNGFHFTQGGSTITQQLIKNNVLTTWTSEDNMYDKVCRKIQEVYLSWSLEKKYDKEWILENYLNTINLGGGTRGVQTASQYYFGKDAANLTLAQSALIAGITKSPTAYNPFKNPEKSLERQKLVLDAMLDQEYISEEEYKEALAEDVTGELDTDHLNYASNQVFSYFEDVLLETVVDDLCEKYQIEGSEAWNMIYSGGLTIYATVDSDLQTICEEKVTDSALYTADEEVSVVMTDVETGAVLALVGGREEKTASLIYNRATDSERQPGSTIKVIGEYAAALDTGAVTLGTVYDDAAMTYSDGTPFKNAYKEYKGKITVRDAIACSSNTAAVLAYRQLGYSVVDKYLTAFGITTLDKESGYESLAIGGTTGGVTNLEMTAAYNSIAAGGYYVEPYYYTTVTDHDGKIILQNDVTGKRVISEETAELLTSAMVSVMSDGTGKTADFKGMDLAGKSGTTNGNKDLWFIGYSPYYTCGVWGGFDDNREQSGSSYVKTLWKNIMQEAVKVKGYKYSDKTFTKLSKDSELDSALICIKCGRLAVKGLCESTVQGNMTRTEYFKKGTVPTENCNCHEKVTVCSESGARISDYCPEENQTTKVYLKSATKDTLDEAYTISTLSYNTCTVHSKTWWDELQESLQEKVDDWTDQWTNWFGGFFGNSEGSNSESGREENNAAESNQGENSQTGFGQWPGYSGSSNGSDNNRSESSNSSHNGQSHGNKH